jgi:hypothetical protein
MKPTRLLRCLFAAFVGIVIAGCGGGGDAGPTPQPAVTNSVRLQSDAGDFVGQGKSYDYTNRNAVLAVTAVGGLLTVSVTGDEQWSASFQVPNTISQLQVGSYNNVSRHPFHNPSVGGLSWSGEGRGCNTLQGSFSIDSVSYVNGNLTSIGLRFEQRCDGSAAALRGQITWSANDASQPPGAVNPPPANLWQPSPGATPSAGNYVYLASESGDFIGLGGQYLYTPATATFSVSANGGHLRFTSGGSETWFGDFQTMSGYSRLQTGYYADLRRYPFHNPTKGGLSWTGEGRGCNTLNGWFVVDNVSYSNDALSAIELRFEQRCDGAAQALRGKIRWVK